MCFYTLINLMLLYTNQFDVDVVYIHLHIGLNCIKFDMISMVHIPHV